MKSNDADKLVSTAREYLWPAFGRDASFFDLPVSLISSGEGRYIIDSFGNRLEALPLGFGFGYHGLEDV